MTPEVIDSGINWFEAFLRHGSAVSVFLSLGCGWGAALFFSYPIHWTIKDPEKATFAARAVCVLASFGITAATWPNSFQWSWALFMGVASPLAGLVVLNLIKDKYPKVYEVLAMKKSS